MTFETRTLESPTGAQLAIYERAANGDARGVLHVNHGLAEHAARYERFADALAIAGWTVVAHDHRGHGATTAADGGPRRYADEDGWSKVMDDVAAVNADIRNRNPGLPIIVFGHSMGGTIAMNYAMRHPDTISGCAVWNANIDKGAAGLIRFVTGLGLTFSKPDKPAGLIDSLTFKAWDKRFKSDRAESGWLSRDLDEVDKYVADPLCGWTASWSLWSDFAEGINYAADDAHLKAIPKSLPVHLMGGTDDPATNGGKAMTALRKRLKRRKFKNVTCEVLTGFRHETINEIGREAVIERFAAWLSKHS
ncbi:MAG: lysophospholipase [Hyphobacterium sp.]|nr:MAG: lysophospholipase [Hyphobacterium sp.]